MSDNLQNQLSTELKHGNIQVALKRCIDYALSSSYQKESSALIRKMADVLNLDDSIEIAENLINEFIKAHDLSVSQNNNLSSQVVLSAKEISKQYKVGSFYFKPISFELRAGTLTGVVGQNGNGKTTLLSMLSGELLSSTGVIDYPLIETNNHDPYAIKQHIGYIQQRIPRWYGVLEDNLKFALSTLNFGAEEIEFRVEIMLKRLGLYAYRLHTWAQISGGYRTRFELAKVLLKRPRVLVLDEPLANLDVKAQQTFLQDLKYMAKTEGHPMAIILSSQLLHEVEQVSDDLFFIKNGETMHQSTKVLNNLDTTIIEFISSTSFDLIQNLTEKLNAKLKSENNFYTLTTDKAISSKSLLKILLETDIDLQYFRDITNSTKRLF